LPVKKKRLYLKANISRNLTKYRNINQSTSYTPSIFDPEKYTNFQPPSITIVDEEDGTSKWSN